MIGFCGNAPKQIESSLKIEDIYDFFRDLASQTAQTVSPIVLKSAASMVDALDQPFTEREIAVLMNKLAGLKSPGNFSVATEVLKKTPPTKIPHNTRKRALSRFYVI